MRTYFIAALCALGLSANAQQINVWRFGQGAGLDFNSGSPVALPAGPIASFETAASICDNQGQLLFYTDGVTVWNRNNIAMPNGTGLVGGNSATQALIVQKPGDCSKYYIFYSGDHVVGYNGAHYSIVDMCLDGGLGDVVTTSKNIQILTNCSEKWTAVKHANGTDVWIICHEMGNANFRKFVLSSSGLSASTVQSIGSVHSNNCTVGYMKASHNGQKLVSATTFNCTNLDMFDFNSTTGQLSSYVDLGATIGTDFYYGIEFSPNDQILYLSDCYVTSTVIQVNLANYAVTSLATSGSNYSYGGLQLGPDGKIYIARTGLTYLSAINNPNTLGVGCGFVNSAVTLAAGSSSDFGLINFVPWYSTAQAPQYVTLGADTTLNCASPLTLAPATACNSTYLWNTGSTASSISVTTQGTYWVEVTNACGISRDTILVNGTSGNASAQFTTSGALDCGSPITFNNTSVGATTYYWNFGDNTSSTSANPTHTYLNVGTYQVMLIASGPCGADTVFTVITINPSFVTAQFTTSGNACGTPVIFTNNSINSTTYVWHFGDLTTSPATNPTHTYNIPGTYQIMLIATGPCDTDTSYSVITIVPSVTTAQFTSSGTACGSPVVFTNSSSNAISFVWDFGDLSTSTATNPTHTYTSPGTYQVMLIATGPCDNDTTYAVVTVVPGSVTAGFTSITSACQGNPIFFSNSSVSATSYSWDFGDSGTSTSTNPLHNYASAGTYTVTLISSGSCATDTATSVITIHPVPVAVISGLDTICSGQTITLTASGGNTYQWSGGSTATTSAINISPSTTTTYIVQTNNGFCNSAPDTHIVVVVQGQTAIISGPSTICVGQSITLTASGGTGYQWSGASNATTSSITVSPTSDTTYIVTPLAAQCAGIPDTHMVTVLPAPSVSVSNDTTICEGQSVTLTASGGGTYQWSGGSTATTASITVAPSTTTPYYVVTSNGFCTSGTDTVVVTVLPSPVVGISGPSNVCPGDTVTLTATGNIISYQWLGSATGSTQTITDIPGFGVNNYYMVGTNSSGCSDTAMISVTLFDSPTVAILGDDTICVGESTTLMCSAPGTYLWSPSTGLSSTTTQSVIATPTVSISYAVQFTDLNGCVGTDTFDLVVDPCTGITETISEGTFTVYPNPADQIINITVTQSELVALELYNAQGQIVISEKRNMVAGSPEVLDLSGLASGIYLIRLSGDTNHGEYPIVIER